MPAQASVKCQQLRREYYDVLENTLPVSSKRKHGRASVDHVNIMVQ